MGQSSGFTLAEILVVIAILAIAGTMLVAVFTDTLRGSNKSQILSVIKQNGQEFLASMTQVIRSADNVVCVTPAPGYTLIIVKNGIYSRYRFIPPNNTVAALGSCGNLSGNANGCFLRDQPDVAASDLKAFINRLCTDDSDPLSNAVTLTDINTQSGVSVECLSSNCIANPIFKRGSAVGYSDQVTLQFNLRPGVDVPAQIKDQIDPTSFQTTIQLR